MGIFAGFVFFCLFPSSMLQMFNNTKVPCTVESLEQEKILDFHNKLRNDFALGKDPRAPGIKVANMMALVWDDDLATLAHCYLNECSEYLEYGGGECPTKGLYTRGQNSVMVPYFDRNVDCLQKAYDEFMNDWYEEIRHTDVQEIERMGTSFTFQQKLRRFTHLVWAETTFVGCALAKMHGDVFTSCILTCKYEPEGNMVGEQMFLYGEPCSACPEDTPCNEKYPGLCGKGEAISVTIPVMFVSLLVQNYL